jgi:hypothetical protein
MVPYLAAEGVGSVQITGGVVEAPFFKLDSWDESRGGTTEAEWLTRRAAPAPWAVLATDKFMTDVPSSWISATTNIGGRCKIASNSARFRCGFLLGKVPLSALFRKNLFLGTPPDRATAPLERFRCDLAPSPRGVTPNM